MAHFKKKRYLCAMPTTLGFVVFCCTYPFDAKKLIEDSQRFLTNQIEKFFFAVLLGGKVLLVETILGFGFDVRRRFLLETQPQKILSFIKAEMQQFWGGEESF